jgi:hypothetical protein
MTPAMRRRLIPLVLVLAGGLLTSCGKGGETTSGTQASAAATSTAPTGAAPTGAAVTRQQALAFAHAVNLTPADVPGFTATTKHDANSSGEKRLEREMLQCAGIARTEKSIAEQGSKNFQLKHDILDFGVSSEVGVQASAAQASQGLAAIRSAHVRDCFSRYISRLFKGQKFGGATVGPVSIQSGTPPAPGTSGGFGWRVTATFMVHGVRVPIYLDFLGFVDGPAEVTLLSSGLLRPFPAEVQQRLFSLLLKRAKEHRL